MLDKTSLISYIDGIVWMRRGLTITTWCGFVTRTSTAHQQNFRIQRPSRASATSDDSLSKPVEQQSSSMRFFY